MPKYRVFIPMMYHRVVEIEASSESAVKAIAEERWDDADLGDEHTAHVRLDAAPVVAWPVEDDGVMEIETEDEYNNRVDEAFDKYQDEENKDQ